MKSFISIAALALLAAMPGVMGHIDMQDPPPIKHKNNKFATSVDNDYTAPIKELCKGYHKLGGADLTPVAKWEAGSAQKFVLGGSAVHGGGSCQAAISEDGGATFKAIKSYIGNCPKPSGDAGTFGFTVPKETKNGPVLFAWTWFNKIGNREMYMNCASIEITGGGSGLGTTYPDILQANIGNGCTTADNQDVAFTSPGKDVEGSGGTAPVGTCGSAGPPPEKTPVEEKPKDGQDGITPPIAPPPTTTPPVVPPPTTTTPPVVPPPTEDDKDTVPPPTEDDEDTVTPPTEDDEDTVTPPPTTQPPSNGGCTDGAIICNTETTWSLCANGVAVPMGAVAPGTKCKGSAITKRFPIRFSKDHMNARKL